MNPALRNALITLACSALAVWLGFDIAEGSYRWPALFGSVALAAVCVRLWRLPFDVIVIGWIIIGYIVGNRGFAQLMPIPEAPLLPAEAALALALGWRFVLSARERALPIKRDPLNGLVLAWLLVGTARIPFDVPRFGLLAVRDYAMIYYAAFFFIAQHMAREAPARRYLIGCVLVASVAVLPIFELATAFPGFFLSTFTVKGSPLVYFKGDLAMTFIAVGGVLIFHTAAGRWRYLAWPLAAAILPYVVSSDSRAALLGAVLAAMMLALARRPRLLAWQGSALLLAGIVVTCLALFNVTWAERKIEGVYHRVQSIVDVSGTRAYETEDNSMKGDNNRFRLVWWRNVAVETLRTNPTFGLGFGHDLAAGFVREYYPESGEEFATRSPHNIAVTAFGRLGLVGVLVWAALCFEIVRRTWRAMHASPEPLGWALWSAVLMILVSATFGVVLEGPMGAVPFWVLLGLAAAGGPAAAALPPETRPDSAS